MCIYIYIYVYIYIYIHTYIAPITIHRTAGVVNHSLTWPNYMAMHVVQQRMSYKIYVMPLCPSVVLSGQRYR